MIRNKPPNSETKFNRVKKMLEKISTFDEWSRLLENDIEKTVALFTVPWCGSCKILAKKLQIFSDENNEENLQYTLIDADSIPEVKSEYIISQYPCFIFFKNGQKLKKFATSRFENFTEEFSLNF